MPCATLGEDLHRIQGGAEVDAPGKPARINAVCTVATETSLKNRLIHAECVVHLVRFCITIVRDIVVGADSHSVLRIVLYVVRCF